MSFISLQILRWLGVAACLLAAIYLLVLARASYLFSRDTAPTVAAAVGFEPHNSVFMDRLAAWQPDNAETLLKRAVTENPLNSDAWIHLGFLAEMRAADPQTAEKYYLKAAEVNHMFLPRWTLANFYFRQQDTPRFFQWSKASLETTPYASDPIFAQMWQAAAAEDVINAAIPDRPRVLLQYAWFLAANKRFESVPPIVDRLLRAVGKGDPNLWGRNDLLAVSLDQMLAAGHAESALAVWSSLASHGWIREQVPNTACPVTNGNFKSASYGHGFDWVFHRNDGVRINPGLSISFSGNQPESLTLFQQYVVLAPNKPYSLDWRLAQTSLPNPSGLAWNLHSTAGVPQILSSGDLLAESSWRFQTPDSSSDTNAWLLTLDYARPLGTIRAEGSLALISVGIHP